MDLSTIDTSSLTEEEIAALKEDDDPEEIDQKNESEDTDNDEHVSEEEHQLEDDDLENEDTDDDIQNESDDELDESDPSAKKEESAVDSKKDEESPSDLSDATHSLEEKIDADLKELDQKFNNGDIEFETYKIELMKLERQRVKAEVAEEYKRLKAEDTWKTEQSVFFASSENLYLRENPGLFKHFATEVNERLTDPAWSKKSGTEILNDAKRAIDGLFGKIEKSSSELDSAEKKKEKEARDAINKAKKKGSDTSTVPKTLKNVDASESNNGEGKFAYLDKLSGQAYEDAVAKLTDAQMQEYLNS